MESAHHFSSRPDCNSTADFPFLILRTALSAIPFVSDLCGVDVHWFQENLHRLQELLQAPLCFLRSFCFARIWLDPLCCQVLYHYRVSIIMSRFTIFIKNFVTCCYQITKTFCRRYGSDIASSARAFVILVVWEISQFRSLGKWV